MTTKFDKNHEDNSSIILGYEGDSKPYDFVIPSCGLEDLDFAVFNLFDKQIPLYYELKGEIKKVPVVFATGERFALLRRKQPITDRAGALILPLVSISRGTIENNPQKGIANNQLFPEVLTRRISEKNVPWRRINNFEGFSNLKNTTKNRDNLDFSLKPQIENNIYETIEIPPVKYFGTSYEITIWSSFTQQMNKLLEAIMSSYTLNPGQQFKVESEKGYWFPAFVESSFSQDTNYADYTDAERYIKYSMTITATGYILSPNIEGGKVGLKSLVSSPTISFEILDSIPDFDAKLGGIQTNSPDVAILDDILNEDSSPIAQRIGIRAIDSLENSLTEDKKKSFLVGESNLKPYDRVGERNSSQSSKKKIFIKDKDGNTIAVKAVINKSGEAIYDQKYAEAIFNITNNEN